MPDVRLPPRIRADRRTVGAAWRRTVQPGGAEIDELLPGRIKPAADLALDGVTGGRSGQRDVVALQRLVGNRAVESLLSERRAAASASAARLRRAQRNVEPVQRQEEPEQEVEIVLPDGELVEEQPGERGPCDCQGCRQPPRRVSRTPAPARVPSRTSGQDVFRKNGTPKPPITDYKVKVGKIGFEFTNPGDKATDPFGSEDFNCSHKDAKTKIKGDRATVSFTIKLHCPWGVAGGGNTDISSATDPAVTTAVHASGKKTYEQIAADLTPAKSDNWRPPRSFYWSQKLTERHERFHSLQDEKWGKTKGKNVVVNHLKGKTVSVANPAADLTALLDGAMTAMSTANWDWYSGGGKAYIDRPGEKAAFREGKSAYQALAWGVKQQGKKLERAERKAAAAAGTP